jgi:type IV secretory pathway VirB10-like protein
MSENPLNNVGEAGEAALGPVPKSLPPPLTGGTPLPGTAALKTRVDPHKPQQVNPVAVRTIFMVSAAVLSCAFVFAFVIAPQVQAKARAKAASENQRTPPGSVKPSDVLAGGPRDYAELTKPAPLAPISGAAEEAKPAQTAASAGPAHQSRVIVERAPREPRPTPAPRQYYERPPAPPSAPQAPRGISELERARRSGLFFEEKGQGSSSTNAGRQYADANDSAPSIARRSDYAEVYGTHAILAPVSPYELKAGTVIPAALLTAVDTQREGRVIAVVTENVFDTVTGDYLLIPQGARLLGRFNGDQTYGERRAFLMWERIIFTDGRSLTLNKEPGVDSTGAGGVTGRVDRRLGQLALAALASGVITTLGEAARRDGEDKSSSLLGEAGDAASIEAARVGGRLIDRELDVKPTIRIAQGTRVQVLLTRDLILEPQQ